MMEETEDEGKHLLRHHQCYKDKQVEQHQTYTINECIQHLGFGWFQIKLTFMLGFVWIGDAIAISTLALLTPALQCYWNLSPEKTAIISTCLFIGMFFGAWFWGWISDVFGRKVSISLSISVMVASTLCSAASPDYRFILGSMAIQGFGVSGAGQSITLLFEILPAGQKNLANMLLGVFYVFGSIGSAGLAVVVMKRFGWRIFMALICLPISAIMLTMWYLPESPRYLLNTGKKEKAKQVLCRIAKDNKKSMPPGELQGIPCYQRKPRGRVADLLNKDHRRTTLLLWQLWFAAIFTYYGVILCTAYLLNKKGTSCGGSSKVAKVVLQHSVTKEFYAKLNITSTNHHNCHEMQNSDYLGFLLTAIGEIPGMLFSFFMAEKIGRKPTLAMMYSISVVVISLLHLCLEKALLVAIIFVLRASVTGLVQTVYLYTPEVYPTHIRAIGFGTASSMARVGAIITPFISQVLIETRPHVAILAYSILMTLCVIGSLLLPLETKNMNLKDSDDD